MARIGQALTRADGLHVDLTSGPHLELERIIAWEWFSIRRISEPCFCFCWCMASVSTGSSSSFQKDGQLIEATPFRHKRVIELHCVTIGIDTDESHLR